MLSVFKEVWRRLNTMPTEMSGWAKLAIVLSFFFAFLPLIFFFVVGLTQPFWYGLVYTTSMIVSYLITIRLEKNITDQIHLKDLKGEISMLAIMLSAAGALVGCWPTTTFFGALGLSIALLASFWLGLKRATIILGA